MASTGAGIAGAVHAAGDAGGARPDAASDGPPTLVDRALGPYRAVTRFLERRTLVRVARAGPRALRIVGAAALARTSVGAVAPPRVTPLLAVGVAADEAFLGVTMAPSRFPRRADYLRVGAELAEARHLFDSRGWLADPRTYHRAPPPLAPDDVRGTRGWAMGLPYERISFASGFTPRTVEPGWERWARFVPNATSSAAIVRHPEEPGGRPWIVCVHGFGTGYAFMDFLAMRTARLHRRLGANIALPVLPLHGHRKVTRLSGEHFLSFDLMNTVHGFAQAVWDIRRLLSWIRAQGATSVALYGVSLGAYVAALVAGFEDGLDAVVAGIPMVDLPALFHELSPLHVRSRSIEHAIIGGNAEELFQAVSPLAIPPKVPVDRRFIFAGHGDRLAQPGHARRLWEHWDRPRITWYPGSHVGYLWSRSVAGFLLDSLEGCGVRHDPGDPGAGPRHVRAA